MHSLIHSFADYSWLPFSQSPGHQPLHGLEPDDARRSTTPLTDLEVGDVACQRVVHHLPLENRRPCLFVLLLVHELECDGVELGADVGFTALWMGGVGGVGGVE